VGERRDNNTIKVNKLDESIFIYFLICLFGNGSIHRSVHEIRRPSA
jgi:hypothetical protein